MSDVHEIDGSRLRSEAAIQVAGFKHLAVLAIAAAVTIDDRVRLANVPMIEDVRVMCTILERLGAQVERRGSQLSLDCRSLTADAIPAELMARIHGAIFLIPALLARLGRVRFSHPGGCRISPHGDGTRTIHHLLQLLARFGAVFVEAGDETIAIATGLTAADLDIADWSTDPRRLEGPLVGEVTKAAILAGILARGPTIIRNACLRAEVVELLGLLAGLGVAIDVRGGTIALAGYAPLLQAGPISLMPDLVEVVTYASCAIHCGISLRIDGLAVAKVRQGLAAETALMTAMGIDLRWTERSLSIARPDVLEPFDAVATCAGIASDCQPFFALMALHARGTSRIRDRTWTRRFAYVPELVKLGARMTVAGDGVFIVPGPLHHHAEPVVGGDARAAAVLAIAALTVPGTRLQGMDHLARAYQDLPAKLRQLGAVIRPLPALTRSSDVLDDDESRISLAR